MGKTHRESLVKTLNRLSREMELEREKEFGKVRSKTWGGKPSSREERRKFKQNVHKYVDGTIEE